MASRSKWEEMTAYPGELVSAVKGARADSARMEASEKGKKLLRETEESIRNKKAPVEAAPTVREKGQSLVDKIKARKAAIDKAGE